METRREVLQPNTGVTGTGSGASNSVSVPKAQAPNSDQEHARTEATKGSCFGAAVTMSQPRSGAIGKMENGAISAWITYAMARW